MFFSQGKLRSLQVLETKSIYLYNRKQFLSAVRWIDMFFLWFPLKWLFIWT